jgi:hypothetical protein
MLWRLHTSILKIHDAVGENVAEEWLQVRDAQKEKVQVAQQVVGCFTC